MKKLTLTIMSLTIILLVSTAVFSVTTNEKPPGNDQGITYVVNIESSYAIGLCGDYYVTISDRNGNAVASPLAYHEGTNSYIFHEAGPVTGERVANLVEIERDHHACTYPIYTKPVTLKTRFRNNMTYIFTLHPVSIKNGESISSKTTNER